MLDEWGIFSNHSICLLAFGNQFGSQVTEIVVVVIVVAAVFVEINNK